MLEFVLPWSTHPCAAMSFLDSIALNVLYAGNAIMTYDKMHFNIETNKLTAVISGWDDRQTGHSGSVGLSDVRLSNIFGKIESRVQIIRSV